MLEFNKSRMADGLLGVTETKLTAEELRNCRIIMQKHPKAETTRYQYWLQPGTTWLPIQESGEWEFGMYERVEGTSYRLIGTTKEKVSVSNPLTPFLQSTMYMNWKPESQCCRWLSRFKGAALAPLEIVELIKSHIKQNFLYDYKLVEDVKLKYDYCPDLDSIWESRKGICFGLTAVFNAALRCYGIPVKMIHGWWGKDETAPYHCWSEVWLDGEWKLIDVTAAITVPALFPKGMLSYKKRYEY